MVSVESWLKSFGFVRNPFETTEAGSEAHYATDLLHETFVKPQGFDEIVGHPSHPKSSLVLAARGKGKTSARLMTAHFCREGIFPKEVSATKEKEVIRVLPIHHTRFEGLSTEASSQSALVDAHVIEILHRAVPSMVDMLIQYPEMAERIDELNTLQRLELQCFLIAFRIYVPFQDYKAARDLLGTEIATLDNLGASIGFSSSIHDQEKLSAQEIQSHLKTYSQMQPIDLLGRFAALMTDLGFGAVYVLVDGLDETPETADDFDAASRLLIPLLANLNLMTNTPYLAFKVFAPSEMESLLLETTRKVRRDRLSVQKIELREGDLEEILHRRLTYCSDEVISSMDAISSVEMRGKMGKEMTLRAEGNPRHLILLGQNMLEHRCRVIDVEERQESYLLGKDDLNWAIRRLEEKITYTEVTNAPQEKIVLDQLDISRPTTGSSSYDWFRHELPAPISLAYLVYQRESDAHIRVWKMYELVESSLAFLSQVLLALLYKHMKKEAPLQLRKSGLRLERTSLGTWRVVLKKLPGMLSGSRIRSSFARSCQRLINKNGDFIRAINDERNNSAHGGPQSAEMCEALIEQYDNSLQQYLKGLSFLKESRLVKVLHVHKHDDNYLHLCISYVGDAIVFPSIEVELGAPLDSERLWFLGQDSPIDLHPLMVVTPDERLGESVWLYHKFDENEVVYKSYGAGMTESRNEFYEEVAHILGTS